MTITFCNPSQLSEVNGLSLRSIKEYRLRGVLTEGIHWQRVNQRVVVYNLPLCLDWLANRSNPSAHQRAIDSYLNSLPSAIPVTKPDKRSRKGVEG